MSGSASDDHVDALLDSLTLEEQVSLLAGADFWHTVAILRAGIPAMRVSDGPAGAGGTLFEGGPASVSAHCGTSLAATWDPNVVEEVGHLLGREARAKGARVLLGPTVNFAPHADRRPQLRVHERGSLPLVRHGRAAAAVPVRLRLGYADVRIDAARLRGESSQPDSVEVDLSNNSARDGVQVVQV